MGKKEISEHVKSFIFLHVDSVELLDVLILLHNNEEKSWEIQDIALELRSNASSIKQKIELLILLGLVHPQAAPSSKYIYKPKTEELRAIVGELSAIFRMQKHKILGLIFSPMKKARDFADAFRKKDGGNDG